MLNLEWLPVIRLLMGTEQVRETLDQSHAAQHAMLSRFP